MIFSLFGFDYVFDISFFQLCFLASVLGLSSMYLISVLNIDYFASANNQPLVFSLLPVTGFVITSTISNNIALSLGMVGALSIVRFRTPVKNPLELVIYFYLITLGIVTNVNPSLAINFTLFFAFVVVASEIYSLISEKFKFKRKSFEDYNIFLRIEVKIELSKLDNMINLMNKSYSLNIYTYNLGFNSKEELDLILKEVNKNEIINYQIDKVKI
jgi:hypothetical protein